MRQRRQRFVPASLSTLLFHRWRCCWWRWVAAVAVVGLCRAVSATTRTNRKGEPILEEDDFSEATTTTTQQLSKRSLQNPNEDFFIIGGTRTEPNEFPAFAHMYYNDWPAGCGGSLIASKWVLTAAHCADDFVVNENLGLPQFRVGSYCTDGDDNGPNCGARATLTQSVSVFLHPQWDPNKLIWDFALAELNVEVSERPFLIDNGIYYRKLDDGELDRVKSIGMGWINDSGVFADYLQQVNNLYLDEVLCFSRFRGGQNFDESVMCTNGANYGNCRGDSGSPSLVYDAALGWIQVGVTSFGPATCENHNEPDGLARVSSAHEWIASVICPSYDNAAIGSNRPDFCPPPPTPAPTVRRTAAPVPNPTQSPTTQRPTSTPTAAPSSLPTFSPSLQPSERPTALPTTASPTQRPTHVPTEAPWVTGAPTSAPRMSNSPTEAPWVTNAPTNAPVPVQATVEVTTDAPTSLKQFRKRQKKKRQKQKQKRKKQKKKQKKQQRRNSSSPPTTAPPQGTIDLPFGAFACEDKNHFEMMDLTTYRCQDIQTVADRRRYCIPQSTASRDCPVACRAAGC